MKKRERFYKHFLFTKLSLVANHMRYFELSRFFMMIFGAFQLGCSSLLGKEADPMLPTPRNLPLNSTRSSPVLRNTRLF